MEYNGFNNQLQNNGHRVQQDDHQSSTVDAINTVQQLTDSIDSPSIKSVPTEENHPSPTAISHSQLTSFFTCTERYENIFQVFPNDFRYGTAAFNQGVHLAKVRGDKEAQLAVIQLFNLFSEEFYLESIGALPPDVWSVWQEQMQSLFRTKLLKEAWAKLHDDFASQAKFQNFVDSSLSDE